MSKNPHLNKQSIAEIRRDVVLLFLFVLAAAAAFYRLNTLFILQWQKPVFFGEKRFFLNALSRPGGLSEYAASFLSFLFTHRLLGAALLALITAAVLWETRRILKRILPQFAVPVLYSIPAVCVICLTSLYTHPLAATLALLWVLIGFDLYLQWNPASGPLRTAWALLLAVLLYALSSAAFLLFALMVTLLELLKRRNATALVLPAAAFLFIVAADRIVFLKGLDWAVLHLLPFHHRYRIAAAPYVLFAFFPALMILGFLIYKKEEPLFDRAVTLRLAQAGAALAFAAAAAVFSFSRFHYDIQQVDYYAANRQWRSLINYMQKRPPAHRLLLFQLYRALYHQGLLLDELFSVSRQERAIKTLVMDREFAMTARMQYSDFLMDLGHVNEAEHWVHEALVHYGETPEVLLRMAQVNLLKGNNAFAEVCLRRLGQNPFYRRESEQLLAQMSGGGTSFTDPYLEGVRRLMFRRDFPQFTYRIRHNLELMRQNNPDNRMVFEYLQAYYLLSGDMKTLMACIDQYKAFGYRRLPRHVEEAAVLYQMISGNRTPDVGGYAFNRETLKRFADYLQIIAAHRGDRGAAQKELDAKHGNTFWYYYMFTLKKLLEEQRKGAAEE